MISTRAKVQAYDSYPLAHTSKDGLRVADAGSMPQMGIAPTAVLGLLADADRRRAPIYSPAEGAGFGTIPQEIEALLTR